jgi:hypothetical protein
MSGAQITRLPTGQIRVSRIIYITDMLRSDTREIPVGVIGEITLPTLLGIGTAIRPAFTDIELSLMGPTARAIVTAPREKLWPSVKESLTVAPRALPLSCYHLTAGRLTILNLVIIRSAEP